MPARRTTTETLNTILEQQINKLADTSDNRLLSVEEVSILKTLADIWEGSRGRLHRGKGSIGPLGKLSTEKLVKYAKNQQTD